MNDDKVEENAVDKEDYLIEYMRDWSHACGIPFDKEAARRLILKKMRFKLQPSRSSRPSRPSRPNKTIT